MACRPHAYARLHVHALICSCSRTGSPAEKTSSKVASLAPLTSKRTLRHYRPVITDNRPALPPVTTMSPRGCAAAQTAGCDSRTSTAGGRPAVSASRSGCWLHPLLPPLPSGLAPRGHTAQAACRPAAKSNRRRASEWREGVTKCVPLADQHGRRCSAAVQAAEGKNAVQCVGCGTPCNSTQAGSGRTSLILPVRQPLTWRVLGGSCTCPAAPAPGVRRRRRMQVGDVTLCQVQHSRPAAPQVEPQPPLVKRVALQQGRLRALRVCAVACIGWLAVWQP